MTDHNAAAAASTRVPVGDGLAMPLLGLGVWQVRDGEQTSRAVGWALQAGYRHVDTAQAYGNERSVGQALREAGVPREEVFLTTKFRPGAADPERELEASLRRLGVDRVDLYLVHWPRGGPTRAWPGMERAARQGLARAIGVSNFAAGDLDAVMAGASIAPAVNQVQFSPFQFRRGLLEACRRHGIVLEAYSPLTHGRDLAHPTVAGIASRLRRTPAQVLLRWAVQRGVPVVPKSVRRERIAENARVFDFELGDDDLRALDALDRTGGTDRALERPWW
ncbi:MAG TPA: aldo/keto reductase [Actinomycetes bacterium]|nr:aldo/keto reductase [Actinomycetes bacterium]